MSSAEKEASRYWHSNLDEAIPSQLVESLQDWVSDNVVAAVEEAFKDAMCMTEVKDGSLVFVFVGPEKPDGECFAAEFDPVAELKEFATPYDDIGGPISDEQREDMRERAEVLRNLSASIYDMAVKAERQGNK